MNLFMICMIIKYMQILHNFMYTVCIVMLIV